MELIISLHLNKNSNHNQKSPWQKLGQVLAETRDAGAHFGPAGRGHVPAVDGHGELGQVDGSYKGTPGQLKTGPWRTKVSLFNFDSNFKES